MCLGDATRQVPGDHHRWCADHRDAVKASLGREGSQGLGVVAGKFDACEIGEESLGVVEVRETVVQAAKAAAESAPPLTLQLDERLAEAVIPVVVLVEPKA